MKIRTTVTEIEATAQELRQSTTLSDAFVSILRRSLIPDVPSCEDDGEDEAEEVGRREDVVEGEEGDGAEDDGRVEAVCNSVWKME